MVRGVGLEKKKIILLVCIVWLMPHSGDLGAP